MARVRSAAPPRRSSGAAPPAEFLDQVHPVWLVPAVFVAFLTDNELTGPRGYVIHERAAAGIGRAGRFNHAVAAWAERHGYTRPWDATNPAAGVTTDWRRLTAEHGIRPCRRLREPL